MDYAPIGTKQGTKNSISLMLLMKPSATVKTVSCGFTFAKCLISLMLAMVSLSVFRRFKNWRRGVKPENGFITVSPQFHCGFTRFHFDETKEGRESETMKPSP